MTFYLKIDPKRTSIHLQFSLQVNTSWKSNSFYYSQLSSVFFLNAISFFFWVYVTAGTFEGIKTIHGAVQYFSGKYYLKSSGVEY